jgi:RecT family
MSGTDVAVRPEEQAIHGFELAERVFTPERRAAVARFLNIAESDPVLVPYLAVCATYGLSPIMGEIWLIPVKVKVRDGDATTNENRYRPAVGRDGFLSIARRDTRFAGLKGAVVCEHDSFEVEYDGTFDEPKVLHRFASKPTIFEADEDPGRYRGRILGAWAKCYVEGQPPQFYFASLREHGQLEHSFEWGQGRGERLYHFLDAEGKRTLENTGKPLMKWAGAWEYVSAMILKAAQSYVLRIAMGITGLAPADEIKLNDATAAAQLDEQPQGGKAYVGATDFDWGRLEAPEELSERIRVGVEAANELAPLSWAPAKIEMVLMGRPVEELEARAQEIEHEVELYEQRIDPPSGEPPAEAEHEPEGQVQDADVVEPPEPLTEAEASELEGLHHQIADFEAALPDEEVGSESHASMLSDLETAERRRDALQARKAASTDAE